MRWREEHSDHDPTTLSNSESSKDSQSKTGPHSSTPLFGGGPGGHRAWRMEQSLFVSDKAQGTRVVHCPTPQELHKQVWNEEYGRGGRLVDERNIDPGAPVEVDRKSVV